MTQSHYYYNKTKQHVKKDEKFQDTILSVMNESQGMNLSEIYTLVRPSIKSGNQEALTLRLYEKLMQMESKKLVSYDRSQKLFTKNS